MRATLVHNSAAGAKQPSAEALMAMLRGAGLSPIYCGAKDKDLPETLARAPGLVVVAGGDGTVARVVPALSGRDIPVVILPLGTANNVAQALGYQGTIEEIIANWENSKEKKLDIGVALGSWGKTHFVEAVGLGALANATLKGGSDEGTVAKRLERGRDAFRKALRKAEPMKVVIELDDHVLKGEMLLVEIMNIGRVGPSLRLAHDADPSDGRLDVVLVPADRREEMLAWLDAPDRLAAPVIVESGSRIVITRGGAPLRVGDKFPDRSDESDVEIELERGAGTILVPSHETGEAPASETGATTGAAQR